MALTDKLTAIADAIRAKGSTTDLLTLDGMVEAINAISAGGGATDVTDSVVSVAFSTTNAYAAYKGFGKIAPEDANMTIFFWLGNESNAQNNQCLFAILSRIVVNDLYIYGRMLYCRFRNSNYDFQFNSTSDYDFIVNSGDTFRMVVIK